MVSLKKRDTASERKESISYAKYCRMKNIHAIHIANEGKRSKAGGSILKSMGMCPGTPDFFHPIMRGNFGGLWIEMKRKKKYSLSERSSDTWKAQENMIEMLREQGYLAGFAFGHEHAVLILIDYLSASERPRYANIEKVEQHVFSHHLNKDYLF